ncbi:D-glycero-alpha-D-manno-heptose-1,7-bisphosphate 7-phosphatase [Paenibacillus xylaniclasticus]|uniref:D-glycero-alpha-D-manno-heptose-1,7-bisphosphate 7-phosphatase n=1 Tax=Paenibacillus xylaniclasticus TaxID=588083 RepID=UPI000FD9E010|nr:MULTISPECIES: HAD family hydrolase [Paenibacillus]GFN32294.1 hypothetical protein PCURB6_25540 [Paenibacillus curdlanolyticus]
MISSNEGDAQNRENNENGDTLIMKAFILDRDGVINVGGSINKKEEFILIAGAAEAIKKLNQLGYEVFVASNQGGVGLGYMSKSALAKLNEYMLELIRAEGGVIRDTRYCIHKPHARCRCRKPMPGMLNDLIEAYGIDRLCSFMVGDRDTDIQAGKSARLQTIFIGQAAPRGANPDYQFESLAIAVTELHRAGII